MEFSNITTKWSSSMDPTFYNINMVEQTKTEKAKAIMNMIIHLKTQPATVETKKTIQSLQQEMGELIQDGA